jgi:hypothetical protein
MISEELLISDDCFLRLFRDIEVDRPLLFHDSSKGVLELDMERFSLDVD